MSSKGEYPMAARAAGLGLLAFLSFLRPAAVSAQSFSFDFDAGFQGWACDFADYNVGDSVNMGLKVQHDTLPGIRPARRGLVFDGQNLSDDLFYFAKRRVTGLTPGAAYSLTFSVDVVTDMPPDGIGGGSLYLKAGATRVEPVKVVREGMYRMNIDKGNQSQPGPDMQVLGFVRHDVPGSFAYRLVNFANASRPFTIQADAQGGVWLIVGTESTFEVRALFPLSAVRATFAPASPILASPGKGRAGMRGLRLSGSPVWRGEARAWDLRGRVPALAF